MKEREETWINNIVKELSQEGFQVRQFPNHHYQIIGGVQPVNWYPMAEQPSVYVNGAARKTVIRGDQDHLQVILRFIKDGVVGNEKVERDVRQCQVGKKKLLQKSRECHWCKKPLTRKTATLEHIIPLSQGGSNREDNLCLACLKCNKTRGALAVNPAAQNDPEPVERLRIEFPDAFWRKFYAGCFAASGQDVAASITNADMLLRRLKDSKI